MCRKPAREQRSVAYAARGRACESECLLLGGACAAGFQRVQLNKTERVQLSGAYAARAGACVAKGVRAAWAERV